MRLHRVIEPLERRRLLSVALVKDINTTQAQNTGVFGTVSAGSIVYLSQDDGANGWELWKTDGTASGTVLVKDINPGAADSSPTFMTMVGSTVYFAANDGTHGTELWKSNGTAAGTTLVKDINPLGSANPTSLLNLSGVLYFAATDGTNGIELWKSDGTSNGTTMVKNIAPLATSSSPTQLVNNNGVLFFAANDGTNGTELWKSDGTSNGTVLVSDIASGSSSSGPSYLVARAGFVYFVANTSANGAEIWRSDGSAGNTTIVKDIVAGAGGSQPQSLTVSASYVYFTCNVTGIIGLYRTDGTAAGTIKLTSDAHDLSLIDVSGTLYFEANASLASTNGTTVSAVGAVFDPIGLTVSNGTLYFAAQHVDSGSQYQLWKVQGTSTVALTNFSVPFGQVPVYTRNITAIGSTGGCVFTGTDASGGSLYKSDGTSVGTVVVRDIFAGTADASVFGYTEYHGALYFNANDGVTGTSGAGELFKSDGTSAGTALFSDIYAGSTGSNPRDFTVYNDRLYFRATSLNTGDELYVTDGTPAGTAIVSDIRNGSSSSTPSGDDSLVPSGNYLYFLAGGVSDDLYRTDGTATGTIDLGGANPKELTDVNGTLFYVRWSSSQNQYELAKTDGVFGNTPRVSNAFTDFNSLTNLNGTLFFATGTRLGKSDGTSTGTVVVGPTNLSPTNLTAVGGNVFFTGNGTGGVELWKSDGTTTVRVKDINASGSSNPSSLVNINGILYFTADDGIHGRELWRSDGTDAGTYIVKDVNGTSASSTVQSITGAYGYVYFTADDGVHGAELWKSDGTTAGTAMVGEVFPGNDQSFTPTSITPFNSAIYFTARDVSYGSEMRKADIPSFASLDDDTVFVTGTANDDTLHVSVSGGSMIVGLNGISESFPTSEALSVYLVGAGGNDSINLDSAFNNVVVFDDSSASLTLNVNAGSHAIHHDLGASGAIVSLNVAAGASLVLTGHEHLAALTIAGKLTIDAGVNACIVTKSLSVTTGGVIDLNDNNMVVDYTNSSPMTAVEGLIFSARNSGGWNGATGITSGSAKNNAKKFTTLGALEASDWKNLSTLNTTFDGEAVDNTAVLIRYTYYGDANFNGKIDGGDYARIDQTFNHEITSGNIGGWLNGDFDFNGKVDGADYALIDLAFNSQTTVFGSVLPPASPRPAPVSPKSRVN